MGHVYLIGNSKFRWYKIGKSRDAHIRVFDLGVLLPFQISVIEVVRCDAYDYVEKHLHREFAEHRINGEWFHFDPDTVNAVCTAMELRGTPVVGIAGFRNMERDFAPPGKVIKMQLAKDLSDEERMSRRKAAISRRDGRAQCRLCRRRVYVQ